MADVHLTRRQYRALAEVAKAFGLGLNLSTFRRMGNCWGSYSPWGLLVCSDASIEKPEWKERALITLAHTINADLLRDAGTTRPEFDWGKLKDHELHSFVVWHEIGHCMDNFNQMEIMCITDRKVREECIKRVRFANEILADRYAWERVRGGQPLPMTERGRERQEWISESISYLEAHFPRKQRTPRPLLPGQYRDVPDYMIATPERAAFVGPHVDPALLQSRIRYHSTYAQQNGRSLYTWRRRKPNRPRRRG